MRMKERMKIFCIHVAAQRRARIASRKYKTRKRVSHEISARGKTENLVSLSSSAPEDSFLITRRFYRGHLTTSSPRADTDSDT